MDNTTNSLFQRCALLIGDEAMDKITRTRIILFGIGGVGSWCAEALIRSGVQHLTIVDFDHISVSNINRQLMATTQTIGQPKTEVLKQRLLQINPQADITAIQSTYSAENKDFYHLEDYDFVIDAIDSLKDKVDLILTVTQLKHTTLLSSMGAAQKMDPTRIRIDEFWKVHGDPLARALRQRFKHNKQFPAHKFKCIYSDELLPNKGTAQEDVSNEYIHKAQINGSVMHITAIFGLMLAAEVIQQLIGATNTPNN